MDMPFKSLKKFGGMKSGGKVRRFQEGGFSAEQVKWLGGADRTDPHILRRMRNAVPDKAPVEDRTIIPVSRPSAAPRYYPRLFALALKIALKAATLSAPPASETVPLPLPKVSSGTTQSNTSEWDDGSSRTQEEEDAYVKRLEASNPPKNPPLKRTGMPSAKNQSSRSSSA
jgi:hypothetical protein